MGVTSIKGPTANSTVGSALSDGITYVSWTNATRVHVGGSNAAVASGTTAGNRGNVWTGCFSNEIPTNSTILGVELVGSGNSRFGNAGSTGASETITYQMRFWNGSTYSAPLVFLSTPTGGSLNGDSTQLTCTGGNRYYVNNTSGTDIFAGASDSLSGITWDPSDQANFGFAILTSAYTDTPIGVILGEGNLGLRVTYTSQYTNTVKGIAPSNISKILGIATSAVSKVKMPGNTVEPIYPDPGVLYQFEDETTGETTDWVPANNWVNGSGAVNGTYWGRTSNKTTAGWRIGVDTTPSGQTGPNGGVDITDGSHVTAASGDNYLFTEASSGGNSKCFVTRTPAINSSNMASTSNTLSLKFWVHAYGSNMGDLYVYIDSDYSSNHSSATELAAYETFSGFTGQSSVWQQKTINLDSYKDGTDYYIYFVSQNGTGFRSDMSIDAVQIIETT